MNFAWFLAWRYLKSTNGDNFIRVVRGFAVVGIALGVAALIVVMAIMNGFREELVNKIVGFNGHVYIKKLDGVFDDHNEVKNKIKTIKNVSSVISVIEGEALLSFDNRNTGIIIRALSADDFPLKPELFSSIVQGSFDFANSKNIVIGKSLAREFYIRMADEVNLVVPSGKVSVFGLVPNATTMEVSGVFDVGMSEYNKTYAFVDFNFARKLLKLEKDAVSFLEVELNNAEDSEIVMKEIYSLIGSNYLVSDWKMKNFSIMNALKTERVAMFTILALIVTVAAFNIISSLTMMVKDKTSDIAIFKTIGASKSQIVSVFVIIGLIIGLIGTGFGTLLGVSFALNINNIKLFLESFIGVSLFDPIIYYLSFMPAKILFDDVLNISILSFSLCLLSTIYPAFRASKLEPVESLRFK
jgi:lipoprotein-releasing system permease protein